MFGRCHRFGWGAKSSRLSDFAATIGLAHDAFVFVDDMAPEREEVTVAMPRIRVLGGDADAFNTAVRMLKFEADRLSEKPLTADAATRTEKTRAVLARAQAAAAYADTGQQLSEASESKVVAGDVAISGTYPASSGGGRMNMARSRRRAAKLAGARHRAAGTGGGYATVGGYPLPFLRTLEIHITLNHLRADSTASNAMISAETVLCSLLVSVWKELAITIHSCIVCDPRKAPVLMCVWGCVSDYSLMRRRCKTAGAGLARAAELAARTTQFNTAHPQEIDAARLLLEALVLGGSGSRSGEVWTMSASDRFGDHGVVGVVALQHPQHRPQHPHTTDQGATEAAEDGSKYLTDHTSSAAAASRGSSGGDAASASAGADGEDGDEDGSDPAIRIKLVAVSCRVLALEVAPVFVSEVLQAAQLRYTSMQQQQGLSRQDGDSDPGRDSDDGAGVVTRARLAITERNMPCRSLFHDLGFVQDDATKAYSMDGGDDQDCVTDEHWTLQASTRLPCTDTSIYEVVVS